MHFHWALSTWAVVASAAEVRHRDGVHRIPKETPDTSTADWRILARAAQSTQLVCANGYSLCPQSLSGGCCAPGYACASDACTATTSGPTTCQGTVGAYACPASLQGKSFFLGAGVRVSGHVADLDLGRRVLFPWIYLPSRGCLHPTNPNLYVPHESLHVRIIVRFWLLRVWLRMCHKQLLQHCAID